MKIEDQLVSLELSKKLKKLGVEQDSYFWWASTFTEDALRGRKIGSPVNDDETIAWIVDSNDWRVGAGLCISAFTATELGELLPVVINQKIIKFSLGAENRKGFVWYEQLPGIKSETNIYDQVGNTEAEARAKMLIYLIENNIVNDICINCNVGKVVAEEAYCSDCI